LSFQIPLPSKAIQIELVNAYESSLQQAQEAEQQANQLEKEIESYLLDTLGIEIKQAEIKTKNKLCIVNSKDVTRWDVDYLLNETYGVFSILNKAKFPVKKLSGIYNFVTRSWKKKDVKEKTFCYVEIGKIDAFLGITGFTEIDVKNAPSRATQVIKKDDLIIGLTRPNLKKFALVSEEYNGYVCSSGFQVIESAKNYSLEFLSEFLKSDAGVKQFEFFMSGALYPAITTKQFKELEIPLPPLEIQAQIVSHINEQKTKIKRLRTSARTLREQAKSNFERAIFE
jgi:restriction endonuclease S subunit